MENRSEEFINFTSVLFQFSTMDCVKNNRLGNIFWLCSMALCFVVGTPAHLWCLWSYLQFDRKNKQSALFLLNQNIMELLICMECAIELLTKLYIKNDKVLIRVSLFIFDLCWAGRPLIQTWISVEQYLAVLHPVTFLRYKGIRYRIPPVIVAWLAAFAYGLYDDIEGIFPDPVLNVALLIALAVISFCCVSVLHALKHPGPGDISHITKQRGRDVGNQQKKNAFSTIISALLIVFLTYIPYILLSIFSVVEMETNIFYCDVLPALTAFAVYGVMVSPMLKMYKERHLECVNWLKAIHVKITANFE